MRRARLPARIWIVVPALVAVACSAPPSERGAGAVEATLTPRVADECLSTARVCAFDRIVAARVADPSAAQPDARDLFDACLEAAAVTDDDDVAVACKDACEADGEEVCDHIVTVLTEYGAQPDACIAGYQNCMDGCRGEADNLTDGFVWDSESVLQMPESWCMWAGSERGTCDSFAGQLAACGGTLADPNQDHESCMSYCEATAVIWVEDSDEDLCADPDADMCQYCMGQCEDVGTAPSPAVELQWEQVIDLEGQQVAQDETRRVELPVPAGVAQLRIVVTPASSDHDPDLVVRAPGASRPACESDGPSGEVETCTIDPLTDRDAVTAGTWTIEVTGYADADLPATYAFSLEASLGRVAAAAAE